ncbi:uncharacterized protein BO95DRAFT_448126 [Aspergillus brunneoviolaceus CBS 621.78]|uniref:Uncharacterized protein n=1 Tax=Aspergillus brunneoviolaceus CBS 621.78 TaxID=1450534 RepID=A0ACD1FT85_9EURO|nr:hypothetical protein BO95DRAFT_448126 [Aspergillus brunneoviolaceus CBS 621.78]RAH40169.1 hypothetical protein BO95DRAFT_448126 [Aspergillus brunneoviolaceus CBS 621.78]
MDLSGCTAARFESNSRSARAMGVLSGGILMLLYGAMADGMAVRSLDLCTRTHGSAV